MTTPTKELIIAKLESKYGVGKVKIYPNTSVWVNGRSHGMMADFAKEFAPTVEQKNEQKMMNTGYGAND